MVLTNLQVATSLNAAGNGLLATKTALNATTAAVQLHAQLTMGAGTANKDGRSKLKIYVAVSPFDITTAQAVISLREQAEELEIGPNQENAALKIKKSDLIPAIGTYAYVFADVPNYSVPPVLDLKLAELN